MRVGFAGGKACHTGAAHPRVRWATARVATRSGDKARVTSATPIMATAAPAITDERTSKAASDVVPVTDDVVKSLISGYVSQPNEYDFWVPSSMIEGEIPEELTGTLFRNGPGLVDVFGKRLSQPFDGDGMINQFSFRDGKLHYKNRYVRTKGFVEEQKQERMLFKGAFSSGNPTGSWFYNPFNFTVKNVANTGVLYWAKALWALHESGLPYKMDARTMATVGESNMDGSIDGNGPFAAHYRITTEADGSKRWCTFGAAVKGVDGKVSFFEYAEDGALLHKTQVLLPAAAFAFFHDMAVTEHYYVLLQNPTKLNIRKLLLEYMFGKCSIAECIAYDTKLPTKVHLIPRPGRSGPPREQHVFETSPFFAFHHGNAYETENDVVVDTIAWDSLSFSGFDLQALGADYYKGGQRSELHRLVVSLSTGSVFRQSLSHRCCEFPTINAKFNAKPVKYMYAPAAAIDHPVYWGPNQVLMKLTLPSPDLKPPFDSSAIATEIWAPGQYMFTLDPLFVQRPGGTAEDDGWILLLLHNGKTRLTELSILDAQRISDGPVCTVKLPHIIPIGLHGCWTDEVLGPALPESYPEHWQPQFTAVKH